ncbi:MAG: ribosome maturation factor RimM [Cellvibrionaceae bacterium]
MSSLVDVGRITGAYGVKGWVKIHSQTEPSENIFSYQPWQLKTRHGVKPVELIEWRAHGKGYVAQVKGIDDRNQAETLCPVVISVDKSSFPVLEQDDFYWHQLQGCRVLSTYEGRELDFGVVKRIMPTGANDVLVVIGDDQSIDRSERLIPYVMGQFVHNVDIEKAIITVDWDPEF